MSLFQAVRAAGAKRRRATKAIANMSLSDMKILADELKTTMDQTLAHPTAPVPLPGLATAPPTLGSSPSAQSQTQSQGHETQNSPDTPIPEGSDTVATSSSGPQGHKAPV